MRFIGSIVPTVGFITGISLLAGTAQADEVSPTGKGIAGGALLGAEAVMLVEAAFKVKKKWAYAVGGGVGAIGGGVGGYFVEQNGDAKLPHVSPGGRHGSGNPDHCGGAQRVSLRTSC